jgi:hypothetical protein
MVGIMLAVLAVGCAIWVYLDATKHKIGKNKETGGFWNMSAGGWAAATLILWIVGFPAYLVKRGSLLKLGQQHPVEVRNRAPVLVVLAAGGAVLIGMQLANYASGSLPACDAPEVMRLAVQIVREAPLIKLSGIEVKGVTNGGEVDYDALGEKRLCRAILQTALGQEAIQYTVEWHDKAKGEIWVQIAQ